MAGISDDVCGGFASVSFLLKCTVGWNTVGVDQAPSAKASSITVESRDAACLIGIAR
jgi:hypothetical protein